MKQREEILIYYCPKCGSAARLKTRPRGFIPALQVLVCRNCGKITVTKDYLKENERPRTYNRGLNETREEWLDRIGGEARVPDLDDPYGEDSAG